LLNLRAGPGTDYAILAGMPQNAPLPIVGRNPQADAWWQVSYQGQIGWASGDYLRTAGPMDRVSEVPIPALPLPVPSETPSTSTTAPAESSLVYQLLLGEMSELIDENHRDELIQKWIPPSPSAN
jgi:uncharacterized protein YraI